ncbi:MAG: hypothetical protein QGF59_16425 [Pirellulaceae bacterium]|jgi:hypothetical protein|nr:hypothetical protein [Pirellulaceae bacterium]MDP6720248.1 hypothetical protein [Pirellulaceae bacterium]
MLTIPGPESRFCDGISRRSWLRIGGLALGGLALPEILRAEALSGAQSGSGSRHPIKGIIMVLGSTTRWGEEPKTRPVHFRDVFATLYRRLGIEIH